MERLFWLLLLAFVVLVALTVVVGRRLKRRDEEGNFAAVTAYRVEHGLPLVEPEPEPEPAADEEDLDAKWSAYWREADLAFRASDLWQQLHADENGLLREKKKELTAALDQVYEKVSARADIAADRLVKRAGYAGMVDMYAQWIHARRRSARRIAAVLAKTRNWPDEWKRQLRVLIEENAVDRARGEVRARRARGEVWAR